MQSLVCSASVFVVQGAVFSVFVLCSVCNIQCAVCVKSPYVPGRENAALSAVTDNG